MFDLAQLADNFAFSHPQALISLKSRQLAHRLERLD
jgi:hypothetical protein